MRAARTGPNAFTIDFENEEELREEHRTNLSQRGLRLPVSEEPALFTPAEVDAPRSVREPGDGQGDHYGHADVGAASSRVSNP